MIDVKRRPHPNGGVFADFVVDGLALSTRASRMGDVVGCLGWGAAEAQDAAVTRLLLEAPPDTPTGRISLYVCKECGHIDCGALAVRVHRDGNVVTWSDFAFDDRLLADLGPFRFQWRLYETAIRTARDIAVTHSGLVHWRDQRPVGLRWVGLSRFPDDGATWPDGSWSMVLTFDYPPAEQADPMPAKLRYLFAETAPQARLQPGVRFSIHEGIRQVGEVDVLD